MSQSSATAPLWVKGHLGSRKEDAALVNKMVLLFHEHLYELGMGGTWILEPYKKTGGGEQERVIFKRLNEDVISGGKRTLMYQIRPHDRDSSWTVRIHPPSDVNLDAFVRKLMKTQVAEENVQAAEPKVNGASNSNFTVNQVCIARVVAHGPNGLDVKLDDKFAGFIPLADICQGKYDRKEMNRFPVNKKLRVVISNVASDKILCSTRVEGIVATDNASDTFTGVLCEDGTLKLAGFSKKQDRVYALVDWLAMDAIDREPHRIPQDSCVDLVCAFMTSQYGAKMVDRRSASNVLISVCSAIEPLLSKNDDGYAITEFGWGEIGGRDKYKVKKAGQSGTVAAVLEVPAPVPATWTKSVESPTMDKVVEYLGKAIRHAEITSQLEALEREQLELATYLEQNSDIREMAEKLSKLGKD